MDDTNTPVAGRVNTQPAPRSSVISNERVTRLRIANTLLGFAALLAMGFFAVSWSGGAALKRENATIKAELRRAPPSVRGDVRAQVGDLVASFGISDAKGNWNQVVYDGRSKYLLFFFSPHCASCEKEFPVWNQIARQARVQNCRVLGLAIEDAASEGPRTVSLDFPVVSIADEAILRAYRVETIPMAVVTSPYGRVEWLHYGPVTDSSINGLLSALMVTQANPTDW